MRITGVGDVQLLEGGLLLALKEILTDEHSAGHSAPTTGSVRCALRASMMGSCADDASASDHGASNRVCRSVLLSRTHRLLLCRFDICCSSRTWRPREQRDENQQGSDNRLLCSGVSGTHMADEKAAEGSYCALEVARRCGSLCHSGLGALPHARRAQLRATKPWRC